MRALMEVTMQRPQGIKRRATDDLERDQRLAKRFEILNIEKKGGKLYVPVTATADCIPAPSSHQDADNIRKTTTTSTRQSDSDMMQVEDTKHRVYIHDLDEELAGAESDEDNPIFIPDIEKHLMKIPRAVLINDADRQKMDNMQLVLYKLPTSLTVPQEQDSVRRLISEARERIRDRQPLTIPDSCEINTNTIPSSTPLNNTFDDSDAMDLG